MTSEEAKHYIEQRLHELGLALELDDRGYEKIHRFTNGTEAGLNQLCFKLVSLTSENDGHEVTTERVAKAIDELARIDDLMKRAGKTEVRHANDELERSSIDQLAAVLEANAAVVGATAETYVNPTKTVVRGGRAAAKRAVAQRPKILVVNEATTTRALIVNALTPDFDCIETADADDAWRRLVHQTDIELVITDVRAHDRAQYDLIGRIRSASAPGHLIGIPIIAMAMTEDATVKQRALVAGANDVIAMSTNAGEIKARVSARYKASRAVPQYGAVVTKTAGVERPPERKNGATTSAKKAAARPGRPHPATPVLNTASLDEVRRPFLNSADLMRRLPSESNRFLGWLHQVSSTTTVTLSATVLVVVLLAVIMYVNRISDIEPMARAATALQRTSAAPAPPPTAETGTEGPAAKPAPSTSTEASAAAAPTAPATSAPADAAGGANEESKRDREATAGVATAGDPRPRQEPIRSATAEPGARSEPRSGPPSLTAPRPNVAETPSAAPPVPENAVTPRDADAGVDPTSGTTSARSATERLTRDDLSTLLKRFTYVYEAGDIEQFMNLFAANARTNDRMNRDGIRQDYETLFRTTDLRQFKLSHINWEVDSNQAHGWGNFEVTVRRAGDQELHNYSGSLTLYIERIEGRPRIVRLYHGQRRAGS